MLKNSSNINEHLYWTKGFLKLSENIIQNVISLIRKPQNVLSPKTDKIKNLYLNYLGNTTTCLNLRFTLQDDNDPKM